MSARDEKPKTLAERFGFKDKDLTTPEHDKMLLWILDKKNSLLMLENLGMVTRNDSLQLNNIILDSMYGRQCDWSWDTHQCSGNCQKTFSSSGADETKYKDATSRNYRFATEQLNTVKIDDFIEIEAEHAILGYNKFNIGFVDAVITIRNCRKFSLKFEDWFNPCSFSYIPFRILGETPSEAKFFVEIKPRVDSIGELIRQINMYRSHTETRSSKNVWIVASKTQNLKEILSGQNIYFYEFRE